MKGALHASSNILRRIPYAVELFGFELVPRELTPPLLKGERDRLWQQPGLFDQVNGEFDGRRRKRVLVKIIGE